MAKFYILLLISVLSEFVLGLGGTSIFWQLRKRWIFAGAVHEQLMEKAARRNGDSGWLSGLEEEKPLRKHKVLTVKSRS